MKIPLSILSLTLLFAVGCAAKIPLANGPETPAAIGSVDANEGPNGNLKLDIEVLHLAPPEKVAAGGQVYVVWVVPKGGAPANLGALKVDSDLAGKLEAVTPHHSFELFITVEESPVVAAPTGVHVLSGTVAK